MIEIGKSGWVGVKLGAGSERRVGKGGSVGAGKTSGAGRGPDTGTVGDLHATFPGLSIEPREKMTRPQSQPEEP